MDWSAHPWGAQLVLCLEVFVENVQVVLLVAVFVV